MKTEFEVVFNYINKDKLIEQIKNLWWVCIKKYSYLKVRDEWKWKITCTYKEQKEWI